MRIHYIQHVAFESIGFLDPILKAGNHTITCTQIWETIVFPEPDSFDGLIIMGGPMSVQDEKEYPWLQAEKKLILEAIGAGKRLMGICLGAQLIAHVLGASVYPNTYKEIGWFPIHFKASFSQWLGSDVKPTLTLFHWHGDTFDLPDGAINHASSVACKNQLFTYYDHVIGLQFHLEVTPGSLNDMVMHDAAELQPDSYVQTANVILNENRYYEEAHALLSIIVKKIFGG